MIIMSRRTDRQRREARRPREDDDARAREPEPEPFDREVALARWQQKLATMTGRGFAAPPFSGLVLGREAPSSRR